MTRLRLLTALAALAVAGVALFQAFRPEIADALYARQVKERMGRDRLAALPDGLHAAFCGTGSPLPDPARAPACTLVIAGKRLFVVDSGAGSTPNILLMGLSAGAVEAAFVTHFHSDHIGGLGDLAMQRWVGGAHTAPLPVHGPDGIDQVVAGFNRAYAQDSVYRPAHHGDAVAPPSGAGMAAHPFAATAEPATVYEVDGVKVTAVLVDHDPARPAVAYRFDHAGRSLVVSGDLDARNSPGFKAIAQGADLLIVETLQPKLLDHLTETAAALGNNRLHKITLDIRDYHTTPEDAAAAATTAGAKALVMSHVVPALPSRMLYPAFMGDAAAHYAGPMHIAEDGMAFVMPAGGSEIRVEDWF